MKLKILKVELLVLFVLTVASVTFFYYRDGLPDSFVSISSTNDSINILSYAFSSFLALCGVAVGMWVLPAFLLFAALYSAVYARREQWIDLVAALSVPSFILGVSYFLFPSLVGDGLLVALSKLHWSYVVLATLLAMAGTTIGIPLRDLRVKWQRQWKAIQRVLALVAPFWEKTVGVTRTLRERLSKKSSDMPKEETVETTETPTETHGAPYVQEEAATALVPVLVQEEVPTPAVEVENVVPPKRVVAVKKAKPTNYKRDELIGCISANGDDRKKSTPAAQYFDDIIQAIEGKLSEFKIEASVVDTRKGPVVDTFEIQLGHGTRISSVESIQDELSLALCGAPIRVLPNMKGRPTMGIEVPRNPREHIFLDEIITSKKFKDADSKFPIAMGKDSFGEIIVTDLARMPHLLIAGSTGSGKSVFMNSLLVSLLVRMSPEKMKLILIDPKGGVEMAAFGKLPHLLLPVIDNPSMSSAALLWAAQEMERRYAILKELTTKNIDGYNERLREATPEELSRIKTHFGDEEPDTYELPNIIIVIDEFADLMLSKSAKEIEFTVSRIAAKARAAGIHLVLATQRPEAKVVTGLIKTNIPARISFKVSSGLDSRIILDGQGGEKLLGNGDMLYKYNGEMTRLHAPFIHEREVEALVEKISERGEAKFSESAMQFIEEQGRQETPPGEAFGVASLLETPSDPMFREAVRIALEKREASASMLQTELGFGYPKARKYITIMEKKGIVGPQQGSRPREVLIHSMEEAQL